jgi:hypothetical protein
MSYIITDKNEVLVDFLRDGTPEWSGRPDIEHVAQQFITKEEAIGVRDELRALGVNPKIVKWDNPNAAFVYKKRNKTMKGNKLGIDTVMWFRAWLDNRLGRRRFTKPFPERTRARILKNEEFMSHESEWDADLAERYGKGLLSLQNCPRRRYNRLQSEGSCK